MSVTPRKDTPFSECNVGSRSNNGIPRWHSIDRMSMRTKTKNSMKILALVSLFVTASAFVQLPKPDVSSTALAGYVPEGMSPEEYRKLRAKEQEEASKKKYGAYGPQSFKSRSLQAFQTDLETGKAGHLMPMFDAKKKLKEGKIKQGDIPYMQRMGSWDNSDLGGKSKKTWTDVDKKYGNAWAPAKLDWQGRNQPSGPQQAKKQQQKPQEKKKGGFMGLF